MSGETYAIVFKGEVVEGFDAATVQAQLSKLLKADAKKTAALFSGKQIVLKKTADKTEAARYGKALKKVGADVKIKVIKADAAAKPAAASKPAAPEPSTPEDAAPSVPVPDFTLAPNEGDLFEPMPEPEAVEVDISDLELAENDDTPLAEPAEEIVVELDLSEFSVKDNDGTPLVEASNEEVPEVVAPDFGLDEPGAVLETLQEEKELLNPNTMGMSLAATGSDLLEEDEKEAGPPPVAPDTSKINLVPNFDI